MLNQNVKRLAKKAKNPHQSIRLQEGGGSSEGFRNLLVDRWSVDAVWFQTDTRLKLELTIVLFHLKRIVYIIYYFTKVQQPQQQRPHIVHMVAERGGHS